MDTSDAEARVELKALDTRWRRQLNDKEDTLCFTLDYTRVMRPVCNGI